jgi:hypothetical protein
MRTADSRYLRSKYISPKQIVVKRVGTLNARRCARRDVAARVDEEGAIESAGRRQRQPRQRGGDAVERNGAAPLSV